MKHTRYLYFLLLCAFCASCKKEEMQPYNSAQYVQFTSSGADTVSLTFLNFPGQNSVDLLIPVMLTGFKTDKDLTFKVAVDASGTNANAKNYTVPTDFVFRAGRAIDTLKVTLHNSTELLTNNYKLAIRLQESPDLKVGQATHSYKYIKFTDQIIKPVWWDDIMDRFGLGIYSEKKYRLFIAVTGVGDMSLHSVSKQLELMRTFKAYLGIQKDSGTPVLENDGTDMLSTVPLK